MRYSKQVAILERTISINYLKVHKKSGLGLKHTSTVYILGHPQTSVIPRIGVEPQTKRLQRSLGV